jgi:dCMP deaminase
MKRPIMPEVFMNAARMFAQRSTCISKQVGGVLVNQGRIIATGYNGVPSGDEHCRDRFSNGGFFFDITDPADREEHHAWSNDNELHVEMNILAYCAKNGIKTDGSIMYLTLSPCSYCARLMYVAGVRTVIYDVAYDKSTAGIDFLREHKINCLSFAEVFNEYQGEQK